MRATLAIFGVLFGLAAKPVAQSQDFAGAVVLFEAKRWSEASAAFAEIERGDPRKTEALLDRAKCLIKLGQYAEAEITLNGFRQNHTQSEDAAYLLGYVLFRENKPKDSLEVYTQAAKLKPPSADDLKIVALNYVLLNDYPDAARYLQKAIQMDPNNVEAHYHLGRVAYQQNRFEQAIAEFQRALQLDPGNTKAQNNLGLTVEATNEGIWRSRLTARRSTRNACPQSTANIPISIWAIFCCKLIKRKRQFRFSRER